MAEGDNCPENGDEYPSVAGETGHYYFVFVLTQ
jgi:hypothetical protein